MFKVYKHNNKEIAKDTDDFMLYIAKNMDGRTFTMFCKFLNELRNDVLQSKRHKISADSFLIFLDKIRTLTQSSHVNDLIIAKLEKVDVDRLQTRALLENYQEHSVDFKFEETLREGEIKEFAKSIMPKPRFIFDNYKVSEDLFS